MFSHEGELVVTDAACPHRGGPLPEGVLRDEAVVCPWHWYAFDLSSGQCRTTGDVSLRRYRVVESGGVTCALVPPVVRRSWSERLRAHARSGQAGV